MNQEQGGFPTNQDTAFTVSSQSQQIYTGAATNENHPGTYDSLHEDTFENKTSAAFPSDSISYQSFLTSTDFNLSDTSGQETQQQDNFTAYQQPQQTYQPPQPQQTYQPPQPQQTYQPPQQQQYQPFEPQQAVQGTQQSDFYSHYDQYNNPVYPQPHPHQPPKHLLQHIHPETPSKQYSSVDNLPHLQTNISSDPPTISQSMMQLSPKEKIPNDFEADKVSGSSPANLRTIWQEAAEELPPMHALFLLLFIFSTAVFCILTEDCLSCLHILPCVSLIALASFCKLGC